MDRECLLKIFLKKLITNYLITSYFSGLQNIKSYVTSLLKIFLYPEGTVRSLHVSLMLLTITVLFLGFTVGAIVAITFHLPTDNQSILSSLQSKEVWEESHSKKFLCCLQMHSPLNVVNVHFIKTKQFVYTFNSSDTNNKLFN